MEVSVKLKWNKALRFNAEVADGRAVEINSAEDMGHAFAPMELFLFALAGCTAMDVVWILERQRQKVDNFEISARGIRRKEDPKYYEIADLEYKIEGKGIRKDAVERAIRLSQQKYCSVQAMINDNVNVRITYKIRDGEGQEQTFRYAPDHSSQEPS
jgi:putative redox protein